MDAMSLVSGVSQVRKKQRGRPRGKNDDESVVGGRAKSTVSGVSGKGKRQASRDESVEEDDIGGDTDINVNGTAAEKQKDMENKAMLVQGLDKEQMLRYEAWRSSKLTDAVVRRVRKHKSAYSFHCMLILILDCQPNAVSVCPGFCYLSHQVCGKTLCWRDY
jgi:transcription initiation factor TFIID subunit 11